VDREGGRPGPPEVVHWAIQTTLAGLRAEWATIEKASALPPPRVLPGKVVPTVVVTPAGFARSWSMEVLRILRVKAA
jgi:hypothetical protein